MFTQFQNYVQRNIGTTAVTVVTCPAANQLVINQLSCANVTGLPVTCTVTVTRASVTVFVVNEAVVPAGGSLACAGFDQKMVIMAGDVIQVRSNTANSIDCVISGVLNDFGGAVTVPAPPASPAATFTVTPSSTVAGEGQTITFNVATTNVPNGTTLYWENFGTLSREDFTDGLNQGEFVINSNAGSFTRTLKSTGQTGDAFGELQETIQMAVQFRPGFIGGNPVTATTVTVVPDTITTLGLRLHWDANNTDSYPGSGTTWFDLSGNGRNGTLVGSPGYASDVVGGRLTFNGTSQTVTVPNPLDQANLSQEWTVSAWINITEKVNQTLVAGLNLGLFVCYLQGNNSLLYLNSGANDYYTYGGDLGTGGWVFATFRFRNSTGQRTIFRNTTDISTGGPNNTSTPSGQAGTFTIASGMEGQLGQLLMYDRYITDAEVLQNFTATRPRFFAPVASSSHAFTVGQGSNRGLFTTDGVNWTETALPSSGIWLDSNYNPAAPGRACALRWGGAIYSTDFGQTWIAATGMGGGGGTVSALAPVTSTVWITIGNGTTEYFRSTDNGQTWSSLNFGWAFGPRAVAGIGAGLAVIVTNSQTYYTTTDGLTFTIGTFPTTPDSTANWTRIEYVNGLYIAMQGVSNGRYIMTSPNGTTWTIRDVSLGASYGGQLRDISFGGALPGTWLIVNDFPTVYFTSTDLVTWTSRTLPTARRWSGIAWIGGQWVAIVDDATQNIKATSTDGINWVESALTTSGARWSDLTEVR